jgi:hypothetical protein
MIARQNKSQPRADTRKTDRLSFRLGGGEYERPPEPVELSIPVIRGKGEPQRIKLDWGERASLEHGRQLLFAACGEVRPEFVEDLNAAPTAALRQLSQGAPKAVRGSALLSERGAPIGLVNKLRYIYKPWQLAKLDHRYGRLRKAFDAWARRFNVLDDWLMDLALDRQCSSPWNEQLLFSFPAASTSPRLSLIGWDLTVEIRTEARARMRGPIEQHFNCVRRSAASDVTFIGWRDIRLTAGRRIESPKAVDVDRAGLVRAINTLADFIGLTLRPLSSERPFTNCRSDSGTAELHSARNIAPFFFSLIVTADRTHHHFGYEAV